MASSADWVDLWERDDEKSLAPLSSAQLEFIDSLTSLCKDTPVNKETEDAEEGNRPSYSNLLQFHNWYTKA
ncbi:hypothetical protein TYRP_021872 [Tyrophagus putrescentiae]|nr:hypothetical protein TYRP_021872 [Tyrophagus putrescentiae]